MDWVKEDGRLSEPFKQLRPHIQYLALAAAEASGIKFNTKPALSLGLEYWNLEQLKIFWQFTAIRRKNALLISSTVVSGIAYVHPDTSGGWLSLNMDDIVFILLWTTSQGTLSCAIRLARTMPLVSA